MNEALIFKLHSLTAFEEALKWGCLRDGNVRIRGVSYEPPDYNELSEIFTEGLGLVQSISHPVEKALVYYFWGALNQFFYDGNKRTSRAVMNYLLLSQGYYYLSVPGGKKSSFNKMMIEFYESRDASEGMAFLLSCYRDFD